MIVAIVETLQIDFIEVQPRTQIFEDLRGTVAVGNESRDESGGFRFLENRNRPLGGNQRLVVGAHQHLRPLSKGVLH